MLVELLLGVGADIGDAVEEGAAIVAAHTAGQGQCVLSIGVAFCGACRAEPGGQLFMQAFKLARVGCIGPDKPGARVAGLGESLLQRLKRAGGGHLDGRNVLHHGIEDDRRLGIENIPRRLLALPVQSVENEGIAHFLAPGLAERVQGVIGRHHAGGGGVQHLRAAIDLARDQQVWGELRGIATGMAHCRVEDKHLRRGLAFGRLALRTVRVGQYLVEGFALLSAEPRLFQSGDGQGVAQRVAEPAPVVVALRVGIGAAHEVLEQGLFEGFFERGAQAADRQFDGLYINAGHQGIWRRRRFEGVPGGWVDQRAGQCMFVGKVEVAFGGQVPQGDVQQGGQAILGRAA